MMEKYKDASLSPRERAEDLLSKLSLAEKMAQVRGVFPMGAPGGPDAGLDRWLLGRGIGQVSALIIQMGETDLDEAVRWQNSLQERIMKESPHGIPAVFHMEGVNGAFFHGAVNYPIGVNRGAAFDPELEEIIAENVAADELAAGITQVLAPVLDVSRDPRMGRCGESYGEEPSLVSALGAAYARGIQKVSGEGRRAAATAKHFAGFHSSRGGVHGGGSSIGERELREIYAKSFQAAITESGLKGVMPCYNVMDGVPFSASRRYLTGLLREEMGFEGVAVSDYGAVDQVYSVKKTGTSFADAGEKCLSAGMDVELPAPVCMNDELEERFATGAADMAVLDRAVLRILEEKFRMGLFEHPFGDLEALKKALGAEKASGAARRAAAESVVLVKNDGILPVSPAEGMKVAVIGPHAANARFYFGGYTHLSMMESQKAARNTLAGLETEGADPQTGAQGGENFTEAGTSTKSSADLKTAVRLIPGTKVQSDEGDYFDSVLRWIDPACPTLIDELKRRCPGVSFGWAKGYPIAGASDADYGEAVALAKDADLVIMTLGGKCGTGSIATMGEGIDATDINLPACQDGLIRELARLGKPLVGIHFGGRPISSDAADECLNAIIEAFCPASFGAEVLVSALLGELNPSGRLPVSVAYNAGQIPVVAGHENGSCWHQAMSIGFPDYVDCSHHPRYAFGHGLSYTSFAYSDLAVSRAKVGPEEETEISFTLTNTGDRDGTEIAQLYLTDEYASVVRPVAELAGFGRIELKAGESRTVRFTVHPSQMAFLDEDMRWKVEKGRFIVSVGAASDDIRLEGEFEVTEDRFIDGKKRKFCALAR